MAASQSAPRPFPERSGCRKADLSSVENCRVEMGPTARRLATGQGTVCDTLRGSVHTARGEKIGKEVG